MNKPRIVFMGTPDFAVPSLNILLANGYEVVGVVTASDKYGGRGGKTLIESAIKKAALAHNIPILQPTKLKAPAFLAALEQLQADLQVVVAFRMLPEVVWNMPPLGTFNLHGSLLPKYRGAAPINWAIIQGEERTGVTTFFLQHEIDTGDMLLQSSIPIGPDDTAADIHDQLMLSGAELVLATLQLIEEGDFRTQKQNHQLACAAPKLFRGNCQIDFNQAAVQVHNFIRGLSPSPSAWTSLHEQEVKIIRSARVQASEGLMEEPFPPGTLQVVGKKRLFVACQSGFIEILSLKPAGKKVMDTLSFLNGNPSVHGQRFLHLPPAES